MTLDRHLNKWFTTHIQHKDHTHTHKHTHRHIHTHIKKCLLLTQPA